MLVEATAVATVVLTGAGTWYARALWNEHRRDRRDRETIDSLPPLDGATRQYIRYAINRHSRDLRDYIGNAMDGLDIGIRQRLTGKSNHVREFEVDQIRNDVLADLVRLAEENRAPKIGDLNDWFKKHAWLATIHRLDTQLAAVSEGDALDELRQKYQFPETPEL